MKHICVILFLLFSFNEADAQTTPFHESVIQDLDSSDYTEALEDLNAHLYRYPKDYYSYLLRARVYEELLEPEEALTNYNIYLEFYPEDSEARFSRAVLRYKMEKLSLAIEDFNHIIRYPGSFTTTTVYFEKAKDSYSRNKIFTTQGGIKSRAYYFLGLCYLKANNYISAISYIDTALHYSENNTDYLTSRALAKERAGTHDAAIDDYRMALQVSPGHTLARYNLSLLLASQAYDLNLLDSLNSIIENGTILPYPFAERGFLNFEAGNYDQALTDFSRALQLDPGNNEYQLNRAKIYIKLEQYESAEQDLITVLDKQPSNEEAYFNLAAIAHKKSQFEEAIKLLDLAIFYYPKYQKAFVNLSIAYYSLKDYANACDNLKKAISLGYVADPKMINSFCER